VQLFTTTKMKYVMERAELKTIHTVGLDASARLSWRCRYAIEKLVILFEVCHRRRTYSPFILWHYSSLLYKPKINLLTGLLPARKSTDYSVFTW